MKRWFAAWTIVVGLTACGGGETTPGDQPLDSPAPTATQASLYDRLGGINAITTVVDSFIAKAAADERINKKFTKSDVPRIRFHLIEQVCNVTGGPCDYTGRDMRVAHANMAVTDGEFDALVQDLTDVLTGLDVPEAERNELLGLLAPLRSQIVESPGPGTGTELPAAFQPAPPLDSAKLRAGPVRS